MASLEARRQAIAEASRLVRSGNPFITRAPRRITAEQLDDGIVAEGAFYEAMRVGFTRQAALERAREILREHRQQRVDALVRSLGR